MKDKEPNIEEDVDDDYDTPPSADTIDFTDIDEVAEDQEEITRKEIEKREEMRQEYYKKGLLTLEGT